MKVYKAQALAVVMIVLVVAAVLGLAMVSRTLKDTRLAVSEQASAEALEFADSIIGTVKGTTVSALETACANARFGDGMKSVAGCSATGVDGVKDLLTTAGISDSGLNVFDQCKDSNSTVEIKIGLAGADDEYEIRQDSTRSFVIREQTPNPATCTLELKFEPRGATSAGVMISKIYARNYVNGQPQEYKPYAYGDIVQYCVHGSSVACSSNANIGDNWTDLVSGATLSIPLTSSGGYALDEIRVRAIGSVIALKSTLSDTQCVTGTEMVKIVTGANCTGSYRAKEVQVPQKDSSISIFDYVLYNGSGGLGPQ